MAEVDTSFYPKANPNAFFDTANSAIGFANSAQQNRLLGTQNQQAQQDLRSQQLGILRKAELVQTRRDARLVFYSLNAETLQGTAKLLCALAGIAPTNEPTTTKAAQSRARGSAATFAKLL